MVLLLHRPASLLVWLLSHLHVLVLAGLVNTTLHSTHPQVKYAPESCCVKNIFGGCIKRYDPYIMSTYIDSGTGMKRTFFQTSSWGNEPHDSNMKRRVEIVFQGQAVYVYGPPQAQLDNLPGHIEVKLDSRIIETIDLEVKYRGATDEPWNPLLIYHWNGGNGDAAHTLEIALLDDANGFWPWFPIRGFGFDSIVFTSLESWQPPKYQPSDSEKLENVTIHDTNFVSKFSPAFAWEKQVSAIASADGTRTFHATSNELAYGTRRGGGTPAAEFTAQCAAVAVYGASPAQLDATLQSGFRHGHVQICQGMNCEYIDAHETYLNVPDHLRNEPVLLYSTNRMSPSSPQAITMRMLDPSSPVGHLWTMTFSHAVCSQVTPKWPGLHPVPNGRYTNHTVPYSELHYGPSYFFGLISPWSWLGWYSVAPAEPAFWFLGLFGGDMPIWSTVVTGHDVKIFLPFLASFESRYGNVLCCIDGRCYYPDVEQWFMRTMDVGPIIPLVHYQDLNPFEPHHISMTVVRGPNEVGEKIIAVATIEVQRVDIVVPPPSPTSPPIPHYPTERHPAPGAPARPPHEIDDNTVRAYAIVALGFVMVVMILKGCLCEHVFCCGSFASSCGISVGRNSLERRGLLEDEEPWLGRQPPPHQRPFSPRSPPKSILKNGRRSVPRLAQTAGDPRYPEEDWAIPGPSNSRPGERISNGIPVSSSRVPEVLSGFVDIYTDPPPYSQHCAPPSYMSCSNSTPVMPPPRRHSSMTPPAPPPRRSSWAEQTLESEAYRSSQPRQTVQEHPRRGGGRHRDRRPLPADETLTGASNSAIGSQSSDRGRGRGRRSGRGRNRNGRGFFGAL